MEIADICEMSDNLGEEFHFLEEMKKIVKTLTFVEFEQSNDLGRHLIYLDMLNVEYRIRFVVFCKHAQWKKSNQWYFITKIVLTYCEKKMF